MDIETLWTEPAFDKIFKACFSKLTDEDKLFLHLKYSSLEWFLIEEISKNNVDLIKCIRDHFEDIEYDAEPRETPIQNLIFNIGKISYDTEIGSLYPVASDILGRLRLSYLYLWL